MNYFKNFIEKSITIHNNKYDYSLVDYKNSQTKVKIICKMHGVFEQLPYAHLQGQGCSLCRNEKNKIKFSKGIDKFIDEANKLHNNRYDYSLVDYKNSHTKVKIICKIHGSFDQLPYSHLQGQGCSLCKNKKNKIRCNKGIDKFIDEANKLHNNRYDYSKFNYITNKKKSTIICKTHGEFELTPNGHISQKIGCKYCKMSLGEDRIYKKLKYMGIDFIYQHQFCDCIYKNKLKFDFYIKEINCCIEFDGEQHEIGFRNNDADIIKLRDSIKNQYCIDNNIELVRINYSEYNKIDTILENKLGHIANTEKSEIILGKIENYLTYDECKDVISKKYKKIKSQTIFKKWKDSDEYDSKIPKNPYSVFKARGTWISWGDFLGTNEQSYSKYNRLDYISAKKWINNNFGSINRKKFIELKKNGSIPIDIIPKDPSSYYKRTGDWISWYDFLDY